MAPGSDRLGELVWSDEFDKPAQSPADPRWWTHETGAHGWGNAELQRYTDDPANASHDGRGNLVIRALRNAEGFTSARLTTRRRLEFAHGRLECRACLPAGDGLWSAVWMLGSDIDEVGWPECGEIDVVECVSAEPDRVFGTVHCPGHSGGDGVGGDFRAPEPLAGGFRVFAVDWVPGSITWSVDGRRYFSVSSKEFGPAWRFDQPFYVLLSLAVGGTLGGRVAAGTRFPAELLIDYVRVYGCPR